MELDLLGDLILQALRFKGSGFNVHLTLHDETTNSDLPAGEMFNENGGRWFMRYESLPGDLSIKAIGVDQVGLYIEVSPLDTPTINSLVEEEMLPVRLDLNQRAFVDIHRQQPLIHISPVSEPEKDLGKRCLLTALFQEIPGAREQAVVNLLDRLYSKNCFEVDEPGEDSSGSTSQAPAQPQGMTQRLVLGLQQKLQLEQRPLLALKTKMTVSGRLEMRLEVTVLLSLERQINRLSGDDLIGFVREHASRFGPVQTERALLFALAGKVKQAIPGLSWREARQQARRLAYQRVA